MQDICQHTILEMYVPPLAFEPCQPDMLTFCLRQKLEIFSLFVDFSAFLPFVSLSLQKHAPVSFICLRSEQEPLIDSFMCSFGYAGKNNTMQVRKQRASLHSSVWIDPAVSALMEDHLDKHPGRASALPDRPHPQSIPIIQKTSLFEASPSGGQPMLFAPTTPIPPFISGSHNEQGGPSRALIEDTPTGPIPGKITTRLPRATIDECETLPPRHTPITRRLHVPQIDELPTMTFAPRQYSPSHVEDLPTMPPAPRQYSPSRTSSNAEAQLMAPLHPASQRRQHNTDALSQTFKIDSRRLAAGQSPFRNPVDRLRWWLLKPGHIEFVLWIGGTLLLMIITLMFFLAAAIGLAWIVPG
jgi:hypothetical protein